MDGVLLDLRRASTAPRRAAVAGLLVAGLVTGCSGGAGGGGSASDPAQAGTAPLPVRTTEVTPSASSSPSAEVPPVLVLEGGGLGLLGEDGSVAPLPFGTTPAEVVRLAVEDAVGPLTAVPLPDCAQGPRTALAAEGFQVLLDADTFAGWADNGAADRVLTTAEGLGLGSTLEEVQSAVPEVQVVPGPTGGSWTTPAGLSGTLSGTDPAAQVTAVWAGQTCAPR